MASALKKKTVPTPFYRRDTDELLEHDPVRAALDRETA
jgi:hypothetical protein